MEATASAREAKPLLLLARSTSRRRKSAETVSAVSTSIGGGKEDKKSPEKDGGRLPPTMCECHWASLSVRHRVSSQQFYLTHRRERQCIPCRRHTQVATAHAHSAPPSHTTSNIQHPKSCHESNQSHCLSSSITLRQRCLHIEWDPQKNTHSQSADG